MDEKTRTELEAAAFRHLVAHLRGRIAPAVRRHAGEQLVEDRAERVDVDRRRELAHAARLLDSPPAWYGVTKERAASIIVDAMASRRPLVAFGPEKIGWWLKRAWPAAHFATIRSMASRARAAISGGTVMRCSIRWSDLSTLGSVVTFMNAHTASGFAG